MSSEGVVPAKAWDHGLVKIPVAVRVIESSPGFWIGRVDDLDLEIYGSSRVDAMQKLQDGVQKEVSDLYRCKPERKRG